MAGFDGVFGVCESGQRGTGDRVRAITITNLINGTIETCLPLIGVLKEIELNTALAEQLGNGDANKPQGTVVPAGR